jgi:hypothetical protein
MKDQRYDKPCERKMERHLKSMSVNELWSLQELAASGRAETATLVAKFRAQQQRVHRLDDYCNQTVAEIIASLDRTQDTGS